MFIFNKFVINKYNNNNKQINEYNNLKIFFYFQNYLF